MSKVEQFVMAYSANHGEIKKLLPEEFKSLRPVLRINVEIITEDTGEHTRIEFNTPVSGHGKRGWFNLKTWDTKDTDIKTSKSGKVTRFVASSEGKAFLDIEHTAVGITGGCPKEDDNDGCFFVEAGETTFVPAEKIDEGKEYCDCEFTWTEPAGEGFDERVKSAMAIETIEVLGAYTVCFER